LRSLFVLELSDEPVVEETRLSDEEEFETGFEMIEGETVLVERGLDPVESRSAERKNPSREDSRFFESLSAEGAEELTLSLAL
jgi:hypothetical protein